jgi:hypothetical protein
MARFKGLTADAFSAYTRDKWSSNVHNLARMRVKDAMLALCDVVQERLSEELEGLGRAASDEIPNITNHKRVDAQWIYWFRDASAQKSLASFLQKTPLDEHKLFDIAPQDKHAILAVVLREQELWIGLRVAPGAVVDRRNLSAILDKTWEREQLVELLADLPEGAELGIEGSLAPTHEVTIDLLAEQATRLGRDDPTWRLGHSLSAEEAIDLGKELADHVHRWLGAFTPHYRFIAWAKSNDHIDVNRQLQEEKAQKRRQALGYSPGDKVRIISGMFAGKIGIVQKIDTKAQVRVQVGKMSVVVPGTDLTAAH